MQGGTQEKREKGESPNPWNCPNLAPLPLFPPDNKAMKKDMKKQLEAKQRDRFAEIC